MRYALSSSEASDNEGPSSSLPPLRDLRTAAGRAGISKAEGSTQSQDSSSPQASSSSLRRTASARRRTQAVGSDEEDEGQASSSIPRPRRVAVSQSDGHKSKASTKTLPPWIKPLRYKSTQQDAGQDDAQEETSRSKLRSGSRRPRPSLSSRRVSFQASDSSGSSSVDHSSCEDSDAEAKADEGLVEGSDTSDSDEELPWLSKSRSKGKGKEVLRSIRLAADEESFEGEWADPLRKNRPQWRSLVSRLSGQLDTTTLANNKSNPPITSIPDDFDEIQATLARLRLEKEEEEKEDRQAFEAREKKLWATIEGAIQAAENEAKQRAKEEADREAAVRRAKEEEERKSREAKETEEKKKKQEEEAKQQALRMEQEKKLKADDEAKKLQAAAAEREASKGMGGGDALRSQARLDYEKWSNKMKDIKENLLPTISGNPAWKKQCFAAKRQITPKVGQLTNSRAEIYRITEFFSNLLNEAKSAGPDPQRKEIYTWVLNHLSKCLIRQAEQEVAVKLDTAFPLARVVCWLIMMGHQELGDVLMARLIKKSCWCLGFVPGQTSVSANRVKRKKHQKQICAVLITAIRLIFRHRQWTPQPIPN